MLGLQNFLIFSPLLLLVSTKSAPKCAAWNFRRSSKCLFKEMVLANDILLADLSSAEDLQKLHISTESLKLCYETMDCKDQEVSQKVNKMGLASESLLYLGEPFFECKRRIENMRAKCKPKMTCENMLGDNYCAREVIIEKCSEEEWVGLRDSMIRLMSVADPYCNIERYRKI